MSHQLLILLGSAAAIGAVHTLLGPDHYVPFITLSKAREWSLVKTAWITILCGLGHVAGSVILGIIGIAAGITLRNIEVLEAARGDIAAWMLTAFGLVYATWGLVRAVRNKPHTHHHAHLDGTEHEHAHNHHGEHLHPHNERRKSLTPWILFTIFVFGPCEPLIPLLMYPAATENVGGAILVAGVFSVVTIGTMTTVVLLSRFGLGFVVAPRLARYGHALAGATIFLSGVAIHCGL
ncbi:sulfite exporter TauE/SafE family protein [Candidatus Eisenbacteria bacterium]|uniref:Sulfite exporter TauE/SafE family protein n=1 Tax=Eiseniibacteriota bacterium TaxID=2212470 RepID=A0ABV6YJJ4_UNCEI